MLSIVSKPIASFMILLSLAMIVSACGRRGALEAPPSELSGYEEPAGDEEKPREKPDKPFFLDPLL